MVRSASHAILRSHRILVITKSPKPVSSKQSPNQNIYSLKTKYLSQYRPVPNKQMQRKKKFQLDHLGRFGSGWSGGNSWRCVFVVQKQETKTNGTCLRGTGTRVNTCTIQNII
ncbi:Hypothetical_protein [Hexamita inflata]|uniref:Hypothetical_protein n=1 Tax=Hexamita inflata TaxID=28002 RepID=A0AA86NBW5_9EUKA|nr:Hypothetical protein HINF_LOCUS4512 [Hexamita inflata]